MCVVCVLSVVRARKCSHRQSDSLALKFVAWHFCAALIDYAYSCTIHSQPRLCIPYYSQFRKYVGQAHLKFSIYSHPLMSREDLFLVPVLETIRSIYSALGLICLPGFSMTKVRSRNLSPSSIKMIGALHASTNFHSSIPRGTIPKIPCKKGM
jgi:hypothetical protein